ncbi:MAG TPA: alanine--tRNA ligase [Lacunisphaera sp.]|jgi:alanyl-tRNA synthetase
MTSAQIRQSFLDFFASKQHTIVPSSSLMPSSPNLLFTNAGMNQFVPYFLGDQTAPWKRVADTQKCIRAGGKHNDLEDVGFDTYHHTMFEMLGNWSFGDYFKKESLTWGWELLTKVWGIPPKRLFATVFCPRVNFEGWESEMDFIINNPGILEMQDDRLLDGYLNDQKLPFELKYSSDLGSMLWWVRIFQKENLDPRLHIVPGNKKDNFWMMGDTGPCGPCSEIHFNLLPSDDETEGRKGVNSSSPRCIEIWNHVFIQFNANADGTFAPLSAKHVDTGMGFERVAGIYATTKGFKDFSAEPSNYNADVFKPTIDRIHELANGQHYYKGSVPKSRGNLSEFERADIAFRVLADHARCVSCAIADGILPGNEGRNYVIRRILRRGIMYGRKDLGLKGNFFEQLVAPVIKSLGDVFPELKSQRTMIERAIRAEEESFGKTLDRGLSLANDYIRSIEVATKLLELKIKDEDLLIGHRKIELRFEDDAMLRLVVARALTATFNTPEVKLEDLNESPERTANLFVPFASAQSPHTRETSLELSNKLKRLPGALAFTLYDTYGFPLDMTQVLATEHGLTVDEIEFDRLMEQQRERGRAARKTDVIVAATEGDTRNEATKFVGYAIDSTHATHAKLVDVVKTEKDTYLVFDQTPFYAEMGGQVGDTGDALINDQKIEIVDCIKDKSGRHLHKLDSSPDIRHSSFVIGSSATLHVNFARRRAIARQHTSAHLLNWALRKILGTHVRQFGTHKTPDRLRFDFTHFEALTAAQIKEAEQLINEKVIDNAAVYYTVVPHAEVSGRTDILQFFGDKYGKEVRVVQIGGTGDASGHAKLDGYSMELCGGTHVTTAGEIGVIKIVAEMAIAAGTRRIEAVAGHAALDFIAHEETALKAVNARLNAGAHDVAQKLEQVLVHQKELEQKLKGFEAKASAALADELAAKAVTKDGLKWVSTIVTTDSPETLRSLGSQILHKLGDGAVQLGATFDGKVSLVAYCSPAAIKAGHQAGKLISGLTAKLGGKGGGKPDFAMGGGGDASKLPEVLKL